MPLVCCKEIDARVVENADQGGSYVTTAFISAMKKRHFSVTPAS